MKSLKRYSIFLLFIGFISISSAQEKTYLATDTEISASVGENFTISLESNQSTGYSWSVGMISDNAQVVVAGMDYDLPEGAKTGQGGAEVWHMKAVSTGTAKVIFYYSRSWEKTAPVNTITYNVTVK